LASGAEVWQENGTEGDSLYCLDPDGHKLETHASDLARWLKADRLDPRRGCASTAELESDARTSCRRPGGRCRLYGACR